MVVTQKSKIFYGYIVVTACFFIMVVYWGTAFSYGIFFDSLIKEFGWNRAVTSGAYSIMGLVFGLTSIFTTKLCDRFGPRRVIGICGTIMGLGYILLSRITSLWQLYVCFDIFVAIGMGSYISLLPLIVRWFSKRRALMTGVISSGMGLGSVVFPPIVHKLISNYEWRTSYIIVAVVIIVVTLIASQFLKGDPRKIGLRPYGESEAESKAFRLTGLDLKKAIHTRLFWLMAALYFTYLFCQTSVIIHIYLDAIGLNVPAASAAGILSVYGIFQIIGMNVMGYTADKYSNKTGVFVAYILMTLSFIWLLLLARDAMTFYIFAAIMGFSGGSLQILFSPLIAETFGLKSHGILLAAISFVGSFGAASGGFVAGFIFDMNHTYTLAFMICGVLAALAIIYTSFIQPIMREKPVEEVN